MWNALVQKPFGKCCCFFNLNESTLSFLFLSVHKIVNKRNGCVLQVQLRKFCNKFLIRTHSQNVPAYDTRMDFGSLLIKNKSGGQSTNHLGTCIKCVSIWKNCSNSDSSKTNSIRWNFQFLIRIDCDCNTCSCQFCFIRLAKMKIELKSFCVFWSILIQKRHFWFGMSHGQHRFPFLCFNHCGRANVE